MGKIRTVILIFILAASFVVRLYRINWPIADWHSWRQVDTASVTKFLMEDGEILYPKYFDISRVQTGYENPAGYRFVEFPIFNIFHAGIYKYSFGLLNFAASGRMVSILAAMYTTLMLYFIGDKIAGKRMGLISAFIYGLTPYNVFFTRLVLPDPLSVAFATGAVYHFWAYTDKENKLHLFTSAILFSMAMLVKPHAIFFALPIAYLALKKFGFKGSLQNISLLIALDIALIPFFAWRAWMGQPPRLVGIPKFDWAFNGNEIRFKPAFWRWIFGERLAKMILGYWGMIFLGLGIVIKDKTKIINLMLLGSFAYVSVFATANVMHDYYQIFILPAVTLAVAYGVNELLWSKFLDKKLSWVLLIFAIFMMFLNGAYFIKGNYQINNYAMVEVGRHADEILPADAKVIAPNNGDTTFLYHINRMGWPVVTTNIDKMIDDYGADYYVSLTKGDTDTVNFKNRFVTVEEGDSYIILDLRKEI